MFFNKSPNYNENNTQSEADIMGKEDNDNKEVYYAKQTIGNACGTMAIIHALANNQNNIEFDGMKFHLCIILLNKMYIIILW